MGDDIVAFCLPDFSKCGPAAGDLVPHAKEGIEYFLSFTWLDATCNGSKDFQQNPFFAFWHNIPLCVGCCCVPCCNCAVFLRTMEKMTSTSCESQCLSCCVLNMCCYLYMCYYAKKRTEFRNKYGLKGAPLYDCLGLCCCGPCTMLQNANECQHSAGLKVPYCSAAAAAEMRNKVTPGPETKH